MENMWLLNVIKLVNALQKADAAKIKREERPHSYAENGDFKEESAAVREKINPMAEILERHDRAVRDIKNRGGNRPDNKG